ncbi:MAG TPA: sucrase/ferredoxin-like family protein, partial [Acidobacteriota bacterium]|nr:sucrase/ferredoxin-like family protein [Acidobacteriota bacterium]
LMPITKVTAYREHGSATGRDFLVFPDALRYAASAEQPEDRIIRQLAGHDLEVPLASSSLEGTYFFVCVHGERDERCGRCGPPVIEALEDYLSAQNVLSNWHVYPCSHVGGHRYAGNLLIYPGGYWYGYVTPSTVSMIVDRVAQGRIFHPLFRGQMSPRS